MKHQNTFHSPSGFTLMEVVVALGVFVIAITSLMGVLPFAMGQVQSSSNESGAMSAMEAVRDDIRLALETNQPESTRYQIEIPASGEEREISNAEGGVLATNNNDVPFRILGRLERAAPGSGEPDFLHLRATWPPKAPVGKETGATELVAAF